jgi:hypothetical protein
MLAPCPSLIRKLYASGPVQKIAIDCNPEELRLRLPVRSPVGNHHASTYNLLVESITHSLLLCQGMVSLQLIANPCPSLIVAIPDRPIPYAGYVLPNVITRHLTFSLVSIHEFLLSQSAYFWAHAGGASSSGLICISL